MPQIFSEIQKLQLVYYCCICIFCTVIILKKISNVTDVVKSYCPQYKKAKLLHEDSCARYYDCGDIGTGAEPYLKECPYPQLFNPDTLTCDDYKYVDCQGRNRPVTPCKL